MSVENKAIAAERKDLTVLMFHLTDGTRIEVRHACPLTREDAHKESCRWAERLEIILPRGDVFGEATVRVS